MLFCLIPWEENAKKLLLLLWRRRSVLRTVPSKQDQKYVLGLSLCLPTERHLTGQEFWCCASVPWFSSPAESSWVPWPCAGVQAALRWVWVWSWFRAWREKAEQRDAGGSAPGLVQWVLTLPVSPAVQSVRWALQVENNHTYGKDTLTTHIEKASSTHFAFSLVKNEVNWWI